MPRDPSTPEPGFYRLRLVKRGPFVAAKITQADGLWKVTLHGAESAPSADPWAIAWMHKVWPYAEAITESDYDYMVAYVAWAEKHAPEDPVVNPMDPINLNSLPSVF